MLKFLVFGFIPVNEFFYIRKFKINFLCIILYTVNNFVYKLCLQSDVSVTKSRVKDLKKNRNKRVFPENFLILTKKRFIGCWLFNIFFFANSHWKALIEIFARLFNWLTETLQSNRGKDRLAFSVFRSNN